MQSSLNAYYASSIEDFIHKSHNEILGEMASNGNFSLELTQRNAWEEEITILKSELIDLAGHVFLEYDVPRIGSRIDAVVATSGLLIIVEFKVGEKKFSRAALNQAWDYALDLKNFHAESHHLPILPILVATEAPHSLPELSKPHRDGVYYPMRASRSCIRQIIQQAATEIHTDHYNAEEWARSAYRPTPTIIEAAQRLFSEHSVDAITQQDAGKINLAVTSKLVEKLIAQAEQQKQKVIIFVTGVPGAGKTLVGLKVATHKRDDVKTHATFLSGNGPLVEVLSEALTEDEYERTATEKPRPRKGEIRQKVKAFIQNVHHFRDAGLRDEHVPSDHVVIFDEAQRAWNKEMTSQFMARKKGRPGFNHSEPEFLISYLNRHQDWAAIICLVGGGQEINQGEAGISAWLDAIRESFSDWHVHLSCNLTDSEYATGHSISLLEGVTSVSEDENLHLRSSMRSFRAENVSNFVKALLDREIDLAKQHFQKLNEKYPIRITRSLKAAKDWIRQQARGTERYGMVASSGAHRLRPHAIDIRVPISPKHWFLRNETDVRSSFYLEEAATEFQVQGLELDWVCVNWDADLRLINDDWAYHSFKGSKWQNVKKADRRQYLLNAYRVLLTRARQGMVIFIPAGEETDPTRTPEYYNGIYDYLSHVGIKEI
tara:strand:- start:339 stop:2315 length:1977 start_codon:yes stop_codon:yes gene_type:complete